MAFARHPVTPQAHRALSFPVAYEAFVDFFGDLKWISTKSAINAEQPPEIFHSSLGPHNLPQPSVSTDETKAANANVKYKQRVYRQSHPVLYDS